MKHHSLTINVEDKNGSHLNLKKTVPIFTHIAQMMNIFLRLSIVSLYVIFVRIIKLIESNLENIRKISSRVINCDV